MREDRDPSSEDPEERFLPEDTRVESSNINEPYQDPAVSDIAASIEGEGAEPYFPPTDPVLTTDRHGEPQVLGGFSSGSMDDVHVARSADHQLGDEAIADAIRRELAQDATTMDLRINVEVRDGVATLSGPVDGMEDGENAEEVASRVPGVKEVRDLTSAEGI